MNRSSESNIPAHASLCNVVAGAVNRAPSKEWVSGIAATELQILCGKGWLNLSCLGF